MHRVAGKTRACFASHLLLASESDTLPLGHAVDSPGGGVARGGGARSGSDDGTTCPPEAKHSTLVIPLGTTDVTKLAHKGKRHILGQHHHCCTPRCLPLFLLFFVSHCATCSCCAALRLRLRTHARVWPHALRLLSFALHIAGRVALLCLPRSRLLRHLSQQANTWLWRLFVGAGRVIIPDTVVSIGAWAFECCTSVTHFDFEGGGATPTRPSGRPGEAGRACAGVGIQQPHTLP